jgi:hypothetical protein
MGSKCLTLDVGHMFGCPLKLILNFFVILAINLEVSIHNYV